MKKYLKAKEELWKHSNISPCKKYNVQKYPLKQTKILPRDHNSITNLKFQHKLKHHLSKILILKNKIDLLFIT
jgi:hypothetical protein